MPKTVLTTAFALLLVVASVEPGRSADGGEVVERELFLMGTRAVVRIEAVDRSAALAASEVAVRSLEAAERRLSTWGPTRGEGARSELARFNEAPVGQPVELSAALAEELRRAQACRRATGGAFDPGVGALVASWELRTGGRIPEAEEVAEAREANGAHLTLEKTGRGPVAVRRHPRLLIEEGGFGKGAGLDAALQALERDPAVLAADLDLGGQVALLRRDGRDRPVSVSLADPRQRERTIARLEVPGGSVATTGNSERGVVVDGRSLGHLIDPRTGRPAPDFGSLTVWAPRALEADCLATGLYVLGPERALAWAEAHETIEAVVARVEDDGRTVLEHTSGLGGRLASLDGTVRLARSAAGASECENDLDSPPADAGNKAGAGDGRSVASEVPSPRSPTDRGRRVAARLHASCADRTPR